MPRVAATSTTSGPPGGTSTSLPGSGPSTVYPVSRAVVASPVEGPLVGLDQSSLSIQGMDFRLRARSGGQSLVVVPLEYSNCLELRNAGPAGSTARLGRVEGLLTGVLFDREVDAVLAFRTGPLVNPSCRWKDYREFKDMVAD